MRHLLLLLFALLPLPCCIMAEEAPLRVLSFNLRYINTEDTGAKMWTERRDAVGALIRKDAADFIGVQEAFRLMLDDVKARAPGYGEVGVGREDGNAKGEYSAILYRQEVWKVADSGTFWLSDTPEVPGSATWGNKVTRICTWGKFTRKQGGREVWVFNAHFDHQSQRCREKGAALILKRISERGSEAPVILTGDFNATPENPAITAFTQGPPAFTDAWLALNAKTPAAESGTFHSFNGKHDGPRIDYIFTTPGITPLECSILHDHTGGNFPSDHFPVKATLQLPAAK